MRNGVTSATALTMASSAITLAILCQLTFISQTIYMWSGIGPLVWNGNTYLGMGTFGGVSGIEETTETRAVGIKLTLSGIDPTLLPEALNDYQQGLPVILWLALFDNNGSIIPNPICSFSGRCDSSKISVDGSGATLEINAESRLIDMNTSVVRRWTPADQPLINPSDLSLRWVPSLVNTPIYWGENATNRGQSSGSAG